MKATGSDSHLHRSLHPHRRHICAQGHLDRAQRSDRPDLTITPATASKLAVTTHRRPPRRPAQLQRQGSGWRTTGGVATFIGLSIHTAGTYVLKATATGLSGGTTRTLEITPATASKLAVTTQPAATKAAGTNFSVGVSVEDTYGNVVTMATTTVKVAVTSGPGTLLGTTTVKATGGVATFIGLSIHTAGTYVLKATSTGLSGATTHSFTITPLTDSKLSVTATSSATAGTPISVTVTAKDAYTNTATNYTGTVHFTSSDTQAVLPANYTFVGGDNGTHTFTNGATLKTSGNQTITATDTGTSSITGTSGEVTVAHAGPTQVVVVTEPPASVTADQSFGLVAKVEDSFGNLVTTSSAAVKVAITTNPSSGTLSGTTTVDASGGIATFSGLSIDKVGTGYTLKVTSGSLTPAVTSGINVTPAVASKLVVTSEPPPTSTAGSPFRLGVSIEDAEGNVVTTSSATVTLAVTSGPGTLLGTTTVQATGGVATFLGLSIEQAGTYVLKATSSGLASATTRTLEVTPVSASAPRGVSAVAPSQATLRNGAVVSWSPPATTGGSPVTGYSIVPTDVTTGVVGSATTAGATARSATVTGLVAGDLYSFTVTAMTVAGPGASSAPSNEVVPVSQLPSTVNSATSTSPTGTATASLGTPGTVGSLTATGTGTGTITVSRYSNAPVAGLTADGTYYDVSISPGNGFTSVVFTVCGVKIGTSVEWWNPIAQQNQPVSDQTAPQGLAGCVTVTITATTTPNLSQLVGTVFTVPSTGALVGPGYTLWGSDGGVYAFGGATNYGSTQGKIVGTATTPDGKGYWQVGSDGGVFSFGDAQFYGSMGGHALSSPVVGMAVTPDGGGYWLVAADGGVFAFGDAGFYGSLGATKPAAPITELVATPDGKGYWLVAADGGVFSFGDAQFYGSMGGKTLAAPITEMAITPDGKGYWLVGADGGVFSFGDAAFYGSRPGGAGSARIVAMAPTPDGNGYWLVGADGGVFAYGDATFYGSMGGKTLAAPIVGMTLASGAKGYWLVGADGGVFSFGDAPFYGSMAGQQLAAPILSLSPGG